MLTNHLTHRNKYQHLTCANASIINVDHLNLAATMENQVDCLYRRLAPDENRKSCRVMIVRCTARSPYRYVCRSIYVNIHTAPMPSPYIIESHISATSYKTDRNLHRSNADMHKGASSLQHLILHGAAVST